MTGTSSVRTFSTIAIFLGAIGLNGFAIAGQKVPWPVTANSTTILGSLADARNSASSMEKLEISDYGNYVYVYGTGANGASAGCATQDATMMAQLRAAQSDAKLLISIKNGTCSKVTIFNSSRNSTKNH